MPTIPAGLESVMLVAAYGLTALLAAAIWWSAGRAGLAAAERRRASLVAVTVLLIWQVSGLVLARAGVFINEPGHLGPWLGVAIFAPVALGLGLIGASTTARRVVAATPLWALVGIEVYRGIGVVFLVLLAAGDLPAAFALPAGAGDLAVGLAAPVVGFALARRPSDTRPAAWWNAFGILDLLVAVSTGFLTSRGLGQLLSLDTPNELITAYPLALVPLYAVPVSFMLHGLVWQRLRHLHAAPAGDAVSAG
jgi:hypothetical protein